MRLRIFPLLGLIAMLAAAPARADMTVYYHNGGWDGFSGPGDNGQPVCGMGSRNPADGRTFSLRYQFGSDDVVFVASKPGWNIPDGTQLPIVVQVGLDRPWSQQAVGSGQRVQWSLARDAMQEFDRQFRGAASMTVTFPSGSEQPWVIELNGSTAVSNAMGRCVTEMASQAPQPAQPEASTPDQGSSTQPFGGAQNTAPNNAPTPVPVQPVNPAPMGQPATQPNTR